MIKKIINHLKKYHEANLWLEQAYIREDKKQALAQHIVSEPEIEEYVTPGYEDLENLVRGLQVAL